MSYIATIAEAGIVPLQDHRPLGGQGIPIRMVRYACRIVDRDPESRPIPEADSTGDVLGPTLWKRSSRSISAWMYASPVIAVKPSYGADVATGPGAETWAPPPNALPAIGTPEGVSYQPDERFTEIQPKWAVYAGSWQRIQSKFPYGTVGVLLGATNEDSQKSIFLHADNRLVSANAAGDPTMSSTVSDLNDSFEYDSNRSARLHTFFRVIRPIKVAGKEVPIDTERGDYRLNNLAIQLHESRLDKAHGYCAFIGHFDVPGFKNTIGSGYTTVTEDQLGVAYGARKLAGGPFLIGGIDDIHQIGTTSDGEPINPLHFSTNTLFSGQAPTGVRGKVTAVGGFGVGGAIGGSSEEGFDPFTAAAGGDAPFLFEGVRDFTAFSFPHWTIARLLLDPDGGHSGVGKDGPTAHKGVWCWYVESPIYIVSGDTPTPSGGGLPKFPDTPTPGSGSGSGSGSGGGSGGSGAGGGPTKKEPDFKFPEFPQIPPPTPPKPPPPPPPPPPPRAPQGDPPPDGKKRFPPWWHGPYKFDTNIAGDDAGSLAVPQSIPVAGFGSSFGVPTQWAASRGVMPYAAMTSDFAVPALLMRPQNITGAFQDLRTAVSRVVAGEAALHDRFSPITARVEAWGASTAGYWDYTQLPNQGRYFGGTSDGGLLFMPPELDVTDYASNFAPAWNSRSTTYMLAVPGVYWGAGLPNMATGSVKTGYRWGADTSGNLQFDSVSGAGVIQPAVRFDTDGRPAIYESSFAKWGTFETAVLHEDRVWTFPDVTGGVDVCVFTQTANKTIADTVTETTLFGTGGGSLDIPADSAEVGTTYRVTMRGFYTENVASNVIVKATLDGTTICVSANDPLSGAGTNDGWEAVVDYTFRTLGAAGTVYGQGHFLNSTGGQRFLISTAAVTVDTTQPLTMDVTFKWGTQDANNTITTTNATVQEKLGG